MATSAREGASIYHQQMPTLHKYAPHLFDQFRAFANSSVFVKLAFNLLPPSSLVAQYLVSNCAAAFLFSLSRLNAWREPWATVRSIAQTLGTSPTKAYPELNYPRAFSPLDAQPQAYVERKAAMKRTYTRRNMTTKPEEGDSPPEVGQKRRKNNIQSEFKPINTLTGNIPGTVTRRQFSGPISCQYGDSDFEIVDERPSRSVLQHHMVGKVAGSGIPTSTIHGQGFRNFRACVVKSGNHGSPRSRAPAPSCPKGHIDNSMVIQSILDDKKEVKDYDDNKISADPVSKPDCTIMRQEAQKATKKPYIPKTNELVKSRQSKKDLWGRRIHPSSPQAYLYVLHAILHLDVLDKLT